MAQAIKGHKTALSETYTASVLLLPLSLRAELPVIGGTSLFILGSKRKTDDVDFAISATALHAFQEAECKDPRLSQGAVAEWTYSCQGKEIKDHKVSLEFLQMSGGFAPTIKVVKPEEEGFRGSMGELVRMKGNTYMARTENSDLKVFCFLPEKMETGEGFEGVELGEEDLETMEATASDCGRRHSNLLKKFLSKVGH